MQVNDLNPREFVTIRDDDEISELMTKGITGKNIYLKTPSEKKQVSLREYQPDKTLDLITDPEYAPAGKTITIYALLDRFIEIDLEILSEADEGMFNCKITKVQKAIHGREHLRFKVAKEQAFSTNFRVSRQALDIGLFTIPTSIKVVLDQFNNSNSRLSDIVKVDIFKNDDNILLKAVKKTGRAVLITDVSNTGSYAATGDDFIDCSAVFGNEVGKVVQKNVEKGYRSILIIPVLYADESERVFPFGYIQLISKSSPLTEETANMVRDLSAKLVERIRDANTVLISSRQEIVDISRGGARLRISDSELKKLLVKQKGFIFDLVFKMEAPVTIYAAICSSFSDNEGNLVIGIDFKGNSSRKNEMRRFYSYIEPMEADYKARLKKSMKKS